MKRLSRTHLDYPLNSPYLDRFEAAILLTNFFVFATIIGYAFVQFDLPLLEIHFGK